VAISAVVPAAGKSRRMGAENKLLMPWNGMTLLRHVVEVLAQAGIEEIVVVTGYERGRVEANLADAACLTVFNPDYEGGMGTSISAGVRALHSSESDVLIALADMPFITESLVREVSAASRSDRIVVPKKADRFGQPIAFGSQFRANLLTLEGDKGAKMLLANFGEHVHFIEVQDELFFEDVDTAERYAQLKDNA